MPIDIYIYIIIYLSTYQHIYIYTYQHIRMHIYVSAYPYIHIYYIRNTASGEVDIVGESSSPGGWEKFSWRMPGLREARGTYLNPPRALVKTPLFFGPSK